MTRRFYAFNSEKAVREHIAQVKTLSDLMQIRYDIEASGTNLTRFKVGVEGAYAVDCVAGDKPFRHVFMAADAFERLGAPLATEADSYSVLK